MYDEIKLLAARRVVLKGTFSPARFQVRSAIYSEGYSYLSVGVAEGNVYVLPC